MSTDQPDHRVQANGTPVTATVTNEFPVGRLSVTKNIDPPQDQDISFAFRSKCSDPDWSSVLGITIFAGRTSAEGWRADVPLDVTCTLTEQPAEDWEMTEASGTTTSPGSGAASFSNRYTGVVAPPPPGAVPPPGASVPGAEPETESFAQSSTSGSSGASEPMARTGGDVWLWAFLGAMLVAAGLAVVAATRKRRRAFATWTYRP